MSPTPAPGGYQPDPRFARLFSAFTGSAFSGGSATSIGTQLTELMKQQSAQDPLLVSTSTDVVCFPGGKAAPRIESFRRSTRGFIEITAVSHLPLAICYVARMRELNPGDERWRGQLLTLIEHALQAGQANTVAMWREQVALPAFVGAEAKVVDLLAYALTTCIEYMQQALQHPSRLDFDELCARFIDAPREVLPVSMNEIMFATFGLAYLDIGYRVGNWLREAGIDWARAMVLVSGQAGRPTAGVTWGSNNICHLIWRASGGQLPFDRLYVAPHAPGFSADQAPGPEGMKTLEQTYRHIWCHTRASVDLARRMFAGYQPYDFQPSPLEAMPPITAIDDHTACVNRLRRIMEDPQQLLANCVADYIVDELQRCGNRPQDVAIPGFSNIDYAGLRAS